MHVWDVHMLRGPNRSWRWPDSRRQAVAQATARHSGCSNAPTNLRSCNCTRSFSVTGREGQSQVRSVWLLTAACFRCLTGLFQAGSSEPTLQRLLSFFQLEPSSGDARSCSSEWCKALQEKHTVSAEGRTLRGPLAKRPADWLSVPGDAGSRERKHDTMRPSLPGGSHLNRSFHVCGLRLWRRNNLSRRERRSCHVQTAHGSRLTGYKRPPDLPTIAADRMKLSWAVLT